MSSAPESSAVGRPRPVFAFPSKGRLREQALTFFSQHGRALVEENGRGLRGRLAGFDFDILMLPAAEIVVQLRLGSVQLGLTGEDLVQERMADWREEVKSLCPLPFGGARIVIAVPQSWVDVDTLDDFDDAALLFRRAHGRRLRVATKYPRLTREFFSRHGLIDYRLVESLGSTEAAPVNEVAEAIVDIVSTGQTLRDNHLKTLRHEAGGELTILESRAMLYLARAWIPSQTGGHVMPRERIKAHPLLEPARQQALKLVKKLGLAP